LHGGIVHAESAGKDQGATFTVELPVMSLPSQAAYAAGAWAGRHPDVEPDTRLLEGLRILVVDDHPDTLEVLRSSLEASGAHVITAESGASALDAYVNSPAAIDAVVSDISMPEMDGYELIRRIRRVEQGGHQRGVAAIALTAYARDDDRERALAEGFRVHVAKPVEPDRLVRVVAEVTGRVSGS